jgi:acyl dehydratase
VTQQQVYFDDVTVGQPIPEVVKGPMTSAHIMRWSASMENWHRIHFDKAYAVEHDKLPDIMVNGSWKQHVLMQLVKDWAGLGGWAWKVSFQFRDMDIPGDTITAWGKVTKAYEQGGLGYVELEIGLKNSRGVESTKGTAVVVLPKRGGAAVPYPFSAA